MKTMRYNINLMDGNMGVSWDIDAGDTLTIEDHRFIQDFFPPLYCNDLTGELWAFDTKLPSGKWLENIRFTNDLHQASAYIA